MTNATNKTPSANKSIRESREQARKCVAAQVFSEAELNIYFDSSLPRKVDGHDTARGLLHKIVNGVLHVQSHT